MSRGFQQNEAGEWEPFDDDLDGFDVSPEGNNIAALTAENERLRKSLEQIGTVCADNASPTCNKGMALKFVADVVRVTLSNGERQSG